MTAPTPAPETLDPADWEAMRQLAHQAIDDGFAYLQTTRERPVWQPIPEDVIGRLRESSTMSRSSTSRCSRTSRAWTPARRCR